MSTPDFAKTIEGQSRNARDVRRRLMSPPAAYVLPAAPKSVATPLPPIGPFAAPGEAWAEILGEARETSAAETILAEVAAILKTEPGLLLIDTGAVAGTARAFTAALLMLTTNLAPKAASAPVGVDPGTTALALLALRELARARLAPLRAPPAILVALLWQPFNRHCEDSGLLTSRPRVFARDIAAAVASRFGIRLDDMLSHRRTAAVTGPRQLAMALAKRLTAMSFPEIGRHIGERDHTTAMHASRKFEPLLALIAADLDADAGLPSWIDRAFVLMQDKKWNGRGA